jgi:hypothetical protein
MPRERYIYDAVAGEVVRVDPGAPTARRSDAKDFRSTSSGCHPEQVQEFNRRFGMHGVRYEEGTGDAIYEDRAAKRRVLKARGIVDYGELW